MGQPLNKDSLDREKTRGEGIVVWADGRRRRLGGGRRKRGKLMNSVLDLTEMLSIGEIWGWHLGENLPGEIDLDDR